MVACSPVIGDKKLRNAWISKFACESMNSIL